MNPWAETVSSPSGPRCVFPSDRLTRGSGYADVGTQNSPNSVGSPSHTSSWYRYREIDSQQFGIILRGAAGGNEMLGRAVIVALLLVMSQGRTSAAIVTGDVQIIGYDSLRDSFSFVTWVDVAVGASIHFTSSGFFDDGTLRDAEKTISPGRPRRLSRLVRLSS